MPPTPPASPDVTIGRLYDFETRYADVHGEGANHDRLRRIRGWVALVRRLIHRRLHHHSPVQPGALSFAVDNTIKIPPMEELSGWIQMDRLKKLNMSPPFFLMTLRHVLAQINDRNSEKCGAFSRSAKGFYELSTDEYRVIMSLPFVGDRSQPVVYDKKMHLKGLNRSRITLYIGETDDPIDPQFRLAIEYQSSKIIVS